MTDLVLSSVEFIAILEQELVSRLETGCSAIFDDRAGSRRRAELLHLKKEEEEEVEASQMSDTREYTVRREKKRKTKLYIEQTKTADKLVNFYLLKKKWTIE